jgi:hypothetical protein
MRFEIIFAGANWQFCLRCGKEKERRGEEDILAEGDD